MCAHCGRLRGGRSAGRLLLSRLALEKNRRYGLSQLHRGCALYVRVVIVVAHRPAVVEALSHVLFLKNGQARDFGASKDVLSRILAPARPTPVAGAVAAAASA